MIKEYKKYLSTKGSDSFWRKAKQREYTGKNALQKILKDLTSDFHNLTTRNSITLRYLGFVVNRGSNRLELSNAAEVFISSIDKQEVLDEQIMKVYLDHPEISNTISIKTIPMKVVLQILKTIRYITFQEYALFICWICSEKEVAGVIKLIKYFRDNAHEQNEFLSILNEKSLQLKVKDFNDNIKRFFDMLMLVSFLKKDRINLMELSIGVKAVDEIIKSVNMTNFSPRNYYRYLTTISSIIGASKYMGLVKKLNKRSKEEKEEIIDVILGRKPLPSITDVNPVKVNIIISDSRPFNTKKVKNKHKKFDYVQNDAANRRNGDYAEKIVMKYERELLEREGKVTLVNRVKQVSLTDDTLGYDVLSFKPNGEEKHIEVKGVKAKPQKSFRFFISANEIDVAKSDRSYFLYIVFSCLTINPLVYEMPNPFKSKIPGVHIFPVKYAAEVIVEGVSA